LLSHKNHNRFDLLVLVAGKAHTRTHPHHSQHTRTHTHTDATYHHTTHTAHTHHTPYTRHTTHTPHIIHSRHTTHTHNGFSMLEICLMLTLYCLNFFLFPHRPLVSLYTDYFERPNTEEWCLDTPRRYHSSLFLQRIHQTEFAWPYGFAYGRSESDRCHPQSF